MKLILIILIYIFSNIAICQDYNLNCDSIKKGIKDEKLYQKLENGKSIFIINLYKNEVYIIRNKLNNSFYYVTKDLKEKISTYNCKDIVIENLPRRKKKNYETIVISRNKNLL
ncbi:MAG: hypothetical protein V4670_00940 [Bacteroidota bacterium]